MKSRTLATLVAAICVGFWWCALPAATLAQRRDTVRVKVVDQTGAVIATATVTATDASGRRHDLVRGDDGCFRPLDLPSGRYRLEIAAEGFVPRSRDLEYSASTARTYVVTLALHLSERVEVEPMRRRLSLDPGNNLSGLTLRREELAALPSDPVRLLFALQGLAGSRGPGDVALYVDGFRSLQRIPPRDLIELIRINANPFAAEFQEPGSRRIEIITKPGSEGIIGQIGSEFGSDVLNARNAFAPERVDLESHSYNGYMSVPIVPNRWGMLLYAGQWHQNEHAVINAMRATPQGDLEPFHDTVPVPTRTANMTIHSSLLARGTTFGADVSVGRDRAGNQGLQGGFDLPERGYERRSRDRAFRFSALSPWRTLVHEVRVELPRRTIESRAISAEPAVIVLNGLSAGGNQDALYRQETDARVQIADSLTTLVGRHTIKGGFAIERAQLSSYNKNNWGGTFTFGYGVERDAEGRPVLDASGQPTIVSPLEQFQRAAAGAPGYGPTQFSIAFGEPYADTTRWAYSWFAQDDWRVSERLTASLGLRGEAQTHLPDKRNFAPRAGLAWAADAQGKGTVRLGAGAFYSGIEPELVLETARYDGRHARLLVIASPDFFQSIPQNLDGAALVPPQIRTLAPELRAPVQYVTTISYERELPGQLYGSIGYTFQQGSALLRARNINAPDLISGRPPDPAHGPVLQLESTGRSTRREMLVSLRTDVGRINLFGNYTLSSTLSDTDGPATLPADARNLANELGPSAVDMRHAAYAGGVLNLPHSISISPSVSMRSGRPFNIVTGSDNNGDTIFMDRPALAAPGEPGAVQTAFGLFQPNPAASQQVIPRNFGRQPSYFAVNLFVSKSFKLRGGAGKGRYFVVGLNVENLTNHTNFGPLNGVVTSPAFGQANGAEPARRITLSSQIGF